LVAFIVTYGVYQSIVNKDCYYYHFHSEQEVVMFYMMQGIPLKIG